MLRSWKTQAIRSETQSSIHRLDPAALIWTRVCDRVRCVVGDAERYIYDTRISFCLLDVDLYKPTIGALRHMWPNLSPGAIVVVDDCKPNQRYDGAFQAYAEFVESINAAPEIVLNKLGILRKRGPSPENSLHSRSDSFISSAI